MIHQINKINLFHIGRNRGWSTTRWMPFTIDEGQQAVSYLWDPSGDNFVVLRHKQSFKPTGMVPRSPSERCQIQRSALGVKQA